MCSRLGMPPDHPKGALRLAAVALAVTWVPMVVLAAMQGLALPGAVEHPLLLDPTGWARIMIGLPMLVLIGSTITHRMAPAIEELRRLVPKAHEKEFQTALQGLTRLAHSWSPDVILLAIAGFTSWLALHAGWSPEPGDWRSLPSSGAPSLARIWSAAVALPIFQFVLMRWGWRIIVWWGFLRRVGRMGLELLPTHPDGFAGLGFLGEAQSAFFLLASPLALIFSTHIVVAAMRTSEDLRSYRAPAAAFVILCGVALMGPALSFVGLLVNARRRAIFEYGRLGQSYVSQFDQKWVHGKSQSEPLLGTPDIQSLADIANSMKVVREISIIPFERRHLILFAASIALPVIPPLLMMMPLTEIISRVAAIVAK
jgi:hypothetical protein